MGWLEDNAVQVKSKASAAKDVFLAEPVAVPMDRIREYGDRGVIVVNRSTGARTLTTSGHAQLLDPNRFDFYQADTSRGADLGGMASPRPLVVEGSNGFVPLEMGLSKRQQVAREKAAALEAVGLGSMFFNPFESLPAGAAIALRTLMAGGAGAATDASVRALNGVPQDMDQLRGTAFTQGGAQLFGEGLGLASTPLAHFFMHKALRPNATMLQDSPSLIEDAIALRAKVRKPGDAPVEADVAKRAAAGAVRNMIQQAEALGGRVPYAEMERRLLTLRNEIALGDPTGDATKNLDDYIAAFQSKWGGGALPTEAQALKRSTQKSAKKVFKAQAASAPVDDVADVRARANHAIAKDVRQALNDLVESLGVRSPSGMTLNQENAAYNRARAVGRATTRAQEIAQSRLDNVLGAATAGAAVGKLTKNDIPGAAATAASMMGGQIINSPQAYSNYALLLSNPNIQRVLQYGPTLLAPMSTTDLFNATPAVGDQLR